MRPLTLAGAWIGNMEILFLRNVLAQVPEDDIPSGKGQGINEKGRRAHNSLTCPSYFTQFRCRNSASRKQNKTEPAEVMKAAKRQSNTIETKA